jgi:hypothetical protein
VTSAVLEPFCFAARRARTARSALSKHPTSA